MKDLFDVHTNWKRIWDYKQENIPESTKNEPLHIQYAAVCAQTAYMCNILKALVVGEAEIERTFSFLRRQLDYTRSKLYPATLENILYVRIHDNMNYETQFEEYAKQIDNKEDETE
ncbi:Hypothetical_protein [Hexamita inflata]|uniref:Hypothetical_protein n=1 Tax=Hexamita inflata TaxID=28002 RepID=A0AA86PMT6_9EUKA|nr:Hypothetical protein HINF_LOCUS25404 [Hexamita inflata]